MSHSLNPIFCLSSRVLNNGWYGTALWQEQFPGRAATVQALLSSWSAFVVNGKSSLPPVFKDAG